MSGAQRLVICIGLILLAVTAMFPPWYGYAGAGNTNRQSLGRSFLPSTPPATIVHSELRQLVNVHDARPDIERMLAEWVAIVSLTGLALVAAPWLIAAPSRLLGQMRRRRGLCGHCGYNLTGNESGVCPECGMKIAPEE